MLDLREHFIAFGTVGLQLEAVFILLFVELLEFALDLLMTISRLLYTTLALTQLSPDIRHLVMQLAEIPLIFIALLFDMLQALTVTIGLRLKLQGRLGDLVEVQANLLNFLLAREHAATLVFGTELQGPVRTDPEAFTGHQAFASLQLDFSLGQLL